MSLHCIDDETLSPVRGTMRSEILIEEMQSKAGVLNLRLMEKKMPF